MAYNYFDYKSARGNVIPRSIQFRTQDPNPDPNKDGEDDKGNVIDWSTVDWSTFDPKNLPETLVKEHPAFKSVLNDNKKQRDTMRELRKRLEQKPEDQGDDEEEKPELTPATKPEEIPAWAKTIISSLEAQQADNLKAWRKAAGEATGIKSDDVLNTLTGANADEVLQKAIKIATDLNIPKPTQRTANPNIVVGSPVNNQRDPAVLEQIKSRMYGSRKRQNPFSPEMQRSMGGGIILNDE